MNIFEVNKLKDTLLFQLEERLDKESFDQVKQIIDEEFKEDVLYEDTKPNKFEHIAIELADLYRRKNHDYGDSFGKTFRELGIISAVTRISDKFNRLVSLATGTKQMVQDEKIDDTLRDLASYCIMTIMELQNEKDR
mgnify:CR=1 FL=1